MSDAELLAYSNGSYSTSDTGCVGDTIGIAPRIYPVPDFVTEFTSWQKALVEEVDACVLQNGVCWILKPSDQSPRYGQEADGGCPGCRGPGPIGFDGVDGLFGDLGKYPRRRMRSMGPARPYQGAVRRNAARAWTPVAVATPQGMAAITPDGSVLPLWQRIYHVVAPDRLVHEEPGMLYESAVRAAMNISQRLGKPRVISSERDGRVVPLLYVEPGGVVRTFPRRRGWETNAYSMTPLEVRQAFVASRGGSLMPHGM